MKEPPAGIEIDRTACGVAFWIHVSPGARRRGVGGSHGGALRVAVAEPAQEGRANAACAAALADALGVGRAAVTLDRRSRGRRKRVAIDGDATALEARLRTLAAHKRLG